MPESSTGDSAPTGLLADKPQRHGFKRRFFLALCTLGAVAIAHTWYSGSHIDNRAVTISRLESGPVTQIISWDGDNTAVQLSQLSELPADDLWHVVTDQGRFDEFMPYVRTTTVSEGPGGTFIEKQVLDLPYASYDVELGISLVEKDNVRTARWEQRKGTLLFNQGAWVVESHGDRSVLRYQVAAHLSGVPQWASNYAMTRRLGRLLDAVEKRVRDLRQSEPGYFE